MECLALDAKSVAGAALPASITSKRADIAIGGVYASADRASTFSLTTPMYRDGMSLLSKDGVGTISALSGKTIGVIQGYLWNAELQQVFGTGNVKIYQASAAMFSDIKNGRVYVGVFTSAEAGYRAQQDPSLKAALLESTPKIAESQNKSNVVLLLEKGATALTAAHERRHQGDTGRRHSRRCSEDQRRCSLPCGQRLVMFDNGRESVRRSCLISSRPQQRGRIGLTVWTRLFGLPTAGHSAQQ